MLSDQRNVAHVVVVDAIAASVIVSVTQHVQ